VAIDQRGGAMNEAVGFDPSLHSGAQTRRIMVLTGKRGGYGAMKPMLRLLRDEPEFELQLVVTDQHVSDRFGRTVREVQQEFADIAVVDLEQEDDSPLGRARALGRCTERMAAVLAQLKPDICVLYGDRGEVLATAMAAVTLNVPIAHIQGGDVSGSTDEPMRHALTKLAHLHFPSTPASAERIRRMGEEAWRIMVVGDNHVDSIVQGDFEAGESVRRRLGYSQHEPIVIVLQHSETTAPHEAYMQMQETLLAVRDTGLRALVVHPCSDAGYEGIIRAIETIATPPEFQVHVNLDAPVFWGLMSTASVMVGNSSAALIEAPYFHLPAVDIGRRQSERQRAENVVHVEHDRGEIRSAIDRVMSAEFKPNVANCSLPFGDGQSFRRIVDCLRRVEIDGRLLRKTMTY
jgi:GDP/UDP-N,N'-diacetylbacillosamine 2-epimerase (hydrolysing)